MSAEKRSDWTSPQTLLAMLGMVGMGFASFQGFQKDTGDALIEMRTRIVSLEDKVEKLELRAEVVSKTEAETNLRLDRIERRRGGE